MTGRTVSHCRVLDKLGQGGMGLGVLRLLHGSRNPEALFD